MRIITAKVQLEKNSVVVSLKGLDSKTNWLAVNHQSLSNFGFDFEEQEVRRGWPFREDKSTEAAE
jgi:hypothetical protein